MFKFNCNVFKSNCASLSKQFNQVRSTCVVYHDLCQESLPRTLATGEHSHCEDKLDLPCHSHECADGQHKLMPSHTCHSPSDNHAHHHNHEHGLVYSKRVRSLLLLNALFSPATARSNSCSSTSLSCGWNSCADQVRHYAKKASHKEKAKLKNANLPKVQLTDAEINSVIEIESLRDSISEVITSLKNDFVSHINVRMGRNIDDLKIQYDGQQFQLKQLAQISRKNENLICINLVNCSDAIKTVINAIKESGICINPQQDGTMLYLPLIKITKEHRENLSKNAKVLLNKSKDQLRNIQNAFLKEARAQKGSKISEDFLFSVCENIKFFIEEANIQCQKLYDAKVKELME